MARMTRKDYATLYGPTTGDAVRLGDTSLLAEIERENFQVLHQRIALTPLRKLWIAWRTWVRG